MSALDRIATRFLAPGREQLASPQPMRTTNPDLETTIGTGPLRQHQAVSTTLIQQPGRVTWPNFNRGDTGAERLALIYRCVNLLSYMVGTAPVQVYNEAGDEKEIKNHALTQRIRKPNRTMGESRFWGQVVTRAAYSGFCVIEKEKAKGGGIAALWPMVSSWLTADPRADGTYDWIYQVPGDPTKHRLKAEDVIHFTYADAPDGSPYGIGPLEVCLRERAVSNLMLDFLKDFFERGAVPLQALILDTWPGQTLDQRQTDQIKDDFVSRSGGLRNAAEPVVLQGIKDVKRLGFDFDELAYQDLHDLNELAIVQAFGIPATVAQIRVGLQFSLSRANAETDSGAFYRNTIIPLWSRLDDALTRQLLPDYDSNDSHGVRFDTSNIPALQDDRTTTAAWMTQAVQAGFMSVHTWHKEMGLDEPEGEDYYLRPMSTDAVPVTDPIPEPEEPVTGQLPPNEDMPTEEDQQPEPASGSGAE